MSGFRPNAVLVRPSDAYSLPLYKHLRIAGAYNLNGNYASPTDAILAPPANQLYICYRMIVHIEDTGALGSGLYGANAALTNGVEFFWLRDGTEYSLTDGVKIKTNGNYSRLMYDISYQTFGAGNNYVAGRWTFANRGAPIELRGNDGDQIIARLNDDFTGIVDHNFLIQGEIIQLPTIT